MSSPSVDSATPVSSPSYAIYDDPLHLSLSDQPVNRLITYNFTGTNFLLWKRDTYLALIAKNKEGFIDGSCKKPDNTDKSYHQWVRCDLMVQQWILNSIDDAISATLAYVHSSKELWDEILDRYGQTNGVEIYQLKQELHGISQDNKPLVEYYGSLKRTWEHIDSIDPLPLCTCKALDRCTCQLLKRILHRENHGKLIHFLMGLNNGYDTVRTNILSMDPLPTLNKALALLQKIERQKQITDAVDVLAEATAYAGGKSFDAAQGDWKRSKNDEDDLPKSSKKCNYCHHIGHTKDECFKLKECSYCGRKGHAKESCYQLRRPSNRPYRGGRFSYRGGRANGYRNAYNVDAFHSDDHTSHTGYTPLDDSTPGNADNHQVPPSTPKFTLDSQVVDGIVTTVMEQVYKVISDQNKPSVSATNFAGPFK